MTNGLSAVALKPMGLPEAVEHVRRMKADAREDGKVFQGVEADFSLTKLLDEIQKVFRKIRLKRHNKLLVIDAERVSRIQLDTWIKQPDADMFIHQPLAFRRGKKVPGARLPEG